MTSRTLLTATTLLLSMFTGCGDSMDGDGSTPRVLSNTPANGATGFAINGSVSVTFSEAMDPSSLASSFKLASGSTAIAGTVIASGSTAVFWPAAYLASDGAFTATVTTDASSNEGVALASKHTWNFASGNTLAPGLPVNLGTAGGFVLLAKSALSTVPPSAITGDVGVSPVAASYITGFGLTAHSSNVYATSPQITGKVYAADYAVPTPSNMTTAISDMELAFTDAASRAPDMTELGAGNIGGMTLAPGVYKWGTGLTIPTNVTLAGSSTGIWIFQIAGDLTVESAQSLLLTGGALSKNVFWQVAGRVELGTTSHLEGTILTQTSITLRTGASVKGRLMAQTAISLDAATVTP